MDMMVIFSIMFRHFINWCLPHCLVYLMLSLLSIIALTVTRSIFTTMVNIFFPMKVHVDCILFSHSNLMVSVQLVLVTQLLSTITRVLPLITSFTVRSLILVSVSMICVPWLFQSMVSVNAVNTTVYVQSLLVPIRWSPLCRVGVHFIIIFWFLISTEAKKVSRFLIRMEM